MFMFSPTLPRPATLAILAALAAWLLPAAAFAEEPAKVLFITGPPSHRSGDHEFYAGGWLLARALNEQSGLPVEVDLYRHEWPEDPAVFEDAAAVVVYADGLARHPLHDHWESIDRRVREGMGVMMMHFAVHVEPGPEGEYFKHWIGGFYETGLSVNPHWVADTEPLADHPVSRGVEAVAVLDEWYWNMRWPEPKRADDLLTAVPTLINLRRVGHWTRDAERQLGTRQTLMWGVEREDGGRGVGFTGGHYHRNWAIDEFRTAVLNAIVWTAGLEVPEDGVRSEPVTEEDLNRHLDEKREMAHITVPDETDLSGTLERVPNRYTEDPQPGR